MLERDAPAQRVEAPLFSMSVLAVTPARVAPGVLASVCQNRRRQVLEQGVSAREEGGRAVPGRLYVLARPQVDDAGHAADDDRGGS